jgi:hypothetical protein
MNSERRRVRRERPRELSYIQFEPESGGIILNISEQGLAFQTATTLRHVGPIQVCVSPTPNLEVKLTAEIMWLDETRKFGGLRFTELAEEARRQIFQWLTNVRESDGLIRELEVPRWALTEATDPCLGSRIETEGQLSSDHESTKLTASDFAIPADLPSWSSTRTLLPPGPFPQEWLNPTPPPRHWNGLAVGCLILVLVFTPLLLWPNFRHEIGNSLIGLGEKLGGNRKLAGADSPSIVVPKSSEGAEIPQLAPSPVSGKSDEKAVDLTVPSTPTQTTEPTMNSTDSRTSYHPGLRKQFVSANASERRSRIARQLWAALGAGDNSAELPLAELYLAGDGVPKSCEQARVLLQAAALDGNIEARGWLKRIHKHKCR